MYAHIDICQLLLEYGANVRKKSNRGGTPLFLAIMRCHLDICQLLIQNGADMNEEFSSGNTLLHETARQPETISSCKLLIENGANINKKK